MGIVSASRLRTSGSRNLAVAVFALVSSVACSTHITDDGSSAGGTRAAAFEPSLPPDSAFVLFGGQTGSDESSGLCASSTPLSIVEVSPIGASASDTADFLSGEFRVRTDGHDDVAQLALTEVRMARFLRYERDLTDGGVMCHEVLEFVAHGLLTSEGETLLDFTAAIRASSATYAQALSLDVETVGGRLGSEFGDGEFGDGESASLLLERDRESRRGWLVVGEIQSSDSRPVAEFGDP